MNKDFVEKQIVNAWCSTLNLRVQKNCRHVNVEFSPDFVDSANLQVRVFFNMRLSIIVRPSGQPTFHDTRNRVCNKLPKTKHSMDILFIQIRSRTFHVFIKVNRLKIVFIRLKNSTNCLNGNHSNGQSRPPTTPPNGLHCRRPAADKVNLLRPETPRERNWDAKGLIIK